MALIKCSECNKEISDQAKMCPHCGYKQPKAKRKASSQSKKKIVSKLVIAIFVLLIAWCGYFFFSPITVKWCCFHHTKDATCTEAEKCIRCGKTWGRSLGHKWQEATCVDAKKCKRCGRTTGKALGHDWQEATCTEPKICLVCKITVGNALGHDWQQATCTTPQMCKICGESIGISTGHVVEDYICTKCGESVVEGSDVENILDITSLKYDVNSVGGIDIYITFSNKLSTKTINYITVEMEFLNAVGDILTDDVSKRKTASLQFTGPLKPGKKSSETYWRACFYNSTFSGTIHLNSIIIEYSDGSKITLGKDIARYAVKNWR